MDNIDWKKELENYHPQMRSHPLIQTLQESIYFASAIASDEARDSEYQRKCNSISLYPTEVVKKVASKIHTFLQYHNRSKDNRSTYLRKRDRDEENWIYNLAITGKIKPPKGQEYVIANGKTEYIQGYVGPNVPNTVITKWGRIGYPKKVVIIPTTFEPEDQVELWSLTFELDSPSIVLATIIVEAGAETLRELTSEELYDILEQCYPDSVSNKPSWHGNIWLGTKDKCETRWKTKWRRKIMQVSFTEMLLLRENLIFQTSN